MESVEEKEEVKEEGTGGDGVEEVKKGDKNFKQTEESEKTRGDVEGKEEITGEDGNIGEKGKKRNSFRLDYIAHMIRR